MSSFWGQEKVCKVCIGRLLIIFCMNWLIHFAILSLGLHKSYYMMKYCTKPQNEIENPVALHLHAYDKASSNCDELADSFSAGRKRIQSMCCTLSNGQEVAAPLAALYLLRESPFYSSHEFAALHLDSIVNVLFNDEQDTVVLEEVHGGAYKPVNVLIDYTCRPFVMDDVSLMEFKKCWEKQKDQKGVLFGPSHPQYHTHSIRRRATDAVVTVFSSRLPDVRRRDTDTEVKLNYCKRLLALFVPFRLSSEFPQSDEKVMDMFVSWWNTSAADSARIYADYSEDYYVSRDVADSKGDDDLIHYDQCTVSDSIVNDGENDSASSEASDNECDPSNMLNFPDCPTLNDEFVKGLARGVETTEHVASTILCDDHVEYNMDLSVLDDAIHEQEVSTDHVNPNIATTDATSTFQDAPTRIEVMNAVEGSEKWEPPIETAEAVVLEPYSTLREVSRHFNLNEKQHKMFVVVGRRLLEALSIDEKMSSRDPLVSFLGGLPGAGKSQVIKSLQALALSWRSSESVGTVSYQGIAAQAANGETIHKFFGWGLRGFSKTKQVTLEQREKITKLKLLILDEISTTDVKIIGMIDSCLRHIRNEPNLLFGGVDVLFVGDWLQQLPVAGVPAYIQTPPCLGHQPRSKRGDYFLRSRGIQAYQQVTNVVMLSQNVRHQGDPEWRDILNRWRTGNYVKEDIDRVNTVSYGEDWRVRNMESSSFCPIIVASNALRSQFNAQSLRAYCQVHTITLHKFSAKLYRRKKPLDRTRKDGLRTIRDDKTGNMAVVLELAFGAPVQCTKNASRALKLANGSIGFVAGFMASDTEVATSISRQQYEEVLHSEPPEVVFVKLRGYEQVHFLPILPVGVVPVRLRLEPSVEIKLPNRTFCIDIEQVPLTPAFSLTTEKCQGMTLEKMVLAPLRHETRVSPQRSSFYVATTRVKLLRQLYLMEKLSLEALEYFTPNAAAVAETQRLESLEVA